MPALRSHDNGSLKHLSAGSVLQAERKSEIRPKGISQPHHSITAANDVSSGDSEVNSTTYYTTPNGGEYPNIASGSSSPAANITPPEILLQIFSMLAPRDFDNARRTCSQWMRVGMHRNLLETMLKRAGWWDAYQQDIENQRTRPPASIEESDVWKMSRRFATECLLAGRKSNIEESSFVATQVIDFSALAQGFPPAKSRRLIPNAREKRTRETSSTFSVSTCSNYVLVTTGCRIHVFQLLGRKPSLSRSIDLEDTNLVPITTIECELEVLSAVLDTSAPEFIIAALLENRVGMVCDLDLSSTGSVFTAGTVKQDTRQISKNNHSSQHYYYNVCSEDHPPRTIALYPGRRCVAFGCAGGIEIHWVDEATHRDQRRHFPMSQPSEALHFLPSTSGTPSEMRLISSLAGPGVHECACRQSPNPDHPKKCQFHMLSGPQSFGRRAPTDTSAMSLVRATHCHHYRAVPINDGYHIIFVEPRTGLLCIGSDAPIGGPTSITRAFICVPPFARGTPPDSNDARSPTVFTVGSDLNWGLRVVAAYQDRIVLYSVPLDVFNVIRKERERQGDGVMGDSDLAHNWFVDPERCRKRRESLVQNQNGDWEFLLSVRYRPTAMMWPFKIYGKEIGRVENIVELALQSSNGGARVWAFSANGQSTLFDIDTFTPSPRNTQKTPRCNSITIASDGSLQFATSGNKPEPALPLRSSRKRKSTQSNDDFVGRYGMSRFVPSVSPESEPTDAVRTGKQNGSSPVRRPSFAACIVDFKIPELGTRTGRWRDGLDSS
ncbi:hypothetical protein N7509_008829 [Penicillium cosmopolitanum]|uniref:F-box domain-containing protein n=1 Tax=Penicillium cosmopolitanum TaxID=1131564 RepID=A0A9W9VN99_9EURO|nr:uncharacterized protein N7509_008829 [Penicillium cosmopolitanum]KAJ5386288.1 hypothetical protein N7509_008829 [Penicillium cosmopolitanum]